MSEIGLNYPIGFDADAAMANLQRFEQRVASATANIRKNMSGMEAALNGTASNDNTAKQADKLDRVNRSSTAAATAASKLAREQREAAKATEELNQKLERETAQQEQLAAMVGRAAQRASAGVKPADPAAPSASGFKVGMSVPRTPGLLQGQNAAMGLDAAGKIKEAALAAKGLGDAAKDVKKTEQAVQDVTKATHLNVGAFREAIVLVREFARGDFTRMAGSATILAQRMGALEKIVPLLSGSMGLVIGASVAGAASLVTFAVAAAQGSQEANRFNNSLQLSGNYAGLTADSYHALAEKQAAATSTSIASNEELIRSLAATNKFTKEEIDGLTGSADRLSKATGEDATDIVASFAKMADGPTKFAQAYQQQYSGVITPQQVAHIQKLEETGHKEEALALLVKTVTDGIARNTQNNTGIIIRSWDAATNSLSNFWTWLKKIGAEEGGYQLEWPDRGPRPYGATEGTRGRPGECGAGSRHQADW